MAPAWWWGPAVIKLVNGSAACGGVLRSAVPDEVIE
jgi:hypothetical protein